MYIIMYIYTDTVWPNLSWIWSKILAATVLCGSLHLYSEFHQERLNESTSWQKKLAGVTVNPLLRESLLLLPPQMNWHLREEKEPCALAKIVTGEGGVYFYDNWRPPRTFNWYCVYPASVVSRAPTYGAMKSSSASQRCGKWCSCCIGWMVGKCQVYNQFNQFVIQSIFISPLNNHPGHSCHIHTLISLLHRPNNGTH